MEYFFLGIICLLLIGIFIYLFIKLNQPQSNNAQDQTLLLLQNQINELTRQIDDRLKETNIHLQTSNQTISQQLEKSNNTLQKQFAISNQTINKINDSTTKTIQEVTVKLTRLDETNKQVVNFATQMQSLENILKNPKQRGVLGEYFLETLLGNVLPPEHYKMQYKFSNGETVDAAIFVKDKIIPIDAKFSLEKYNLIMEEKDKTKRTNLEKQFIEDIKKRIDETSKYIRPSENTTDFALMFMPAEGIFYNLLTYNIGTANLNSHNLIEHSFTKKVIIVSPSSFIAYLQIVIQALNSLRVEESVKDIINNIRNLSRHLKSYNEYMIGIGKNLQSTVNKYNDGYREFKKIDKDITRISGQNNQIEPLFVDKPQIE